MKATPAVIKVLRVMGEIPVVVEKWNPYARKHQDLYGFIDIVSTPRGIGPLRLVQVFNETKSGGERSRHLRKIYEDDEMRTVFYSLAANPGLSLEFWALKKSHRKGYYFLVTVMGPRGEIARRYRVTMDGRMEAVKQGAPPCQK